MKKSVTLLLSVIMGISLIACSGGTASSSGENSASEPSGSTAEAPEKTPSSSDTPEESAESAETSFDPEGAEEPEESTEEAGSMLVAFFSWSGNTEQMARMIQSYTSGDLFAIEPATPYTDDYDTLLDVARQEQSDNARPELTAQVDNWDSYDVVFVGYPDWWSDAPMIIYSFLESYDWSGKVLVPFCTSGGSGFGRSLDKLPDSAPGATVLEGLHIAGDSVSGASEKVASWIDSLHLF